jgi:hypothetical protein
MGDANAPAKCNLPASVPSAPSFFLRDKTRFVRHYTNNGCFTSPTSTARTKDAELMSDDRADRNDRDFNT